MYGLHQQQTSTHPLAVRHQSGNLKTINLDAFQQTPLATDPYDHIVVPNFIQPGPLAAVMRDFPDLPGTGIFPIHAVTAGPAFNQFMAEFKSPEVVDAFSEKFGLDLSQLPFLATVRGHMQARDGRIHTDTESKVITVLIYLNETWPHKGGRLRVLRDGKNMENYTTEVAPLAGTLLSFRRCDHSWHGHPSYVGPRRSIQLNWVRDKDFVDEQYSRHGLSAFVKGVQNIFSFKE